ncbi:hypothetical protein SVAN01_00553 [Stagonosporopsis vannaccii]|nr:hypothetical protein SVAN01_00553 [Stagonosporopsis vannaccii]
MLGANSTATSRRNRPLRASCGLIIQCGRRSDNVNVQASTRPHFQAVPVSVLFVVPLRAQSHFPPSNIGSILKLALEAPRAIHLILQTPGRVKQKGRSNVETNIERPCLKRRWWIQSECTSKAMPEVSNAAGRAVCMSSYPSRLCIDTSSQDAPSLHGLHNSADHTCLGAQPTCETHKPETRSAA